MKSSTVGATPRTPGGQWSNANTPRSAGYKAPEKVTSWRNGRAVTSRQWLSATVATQVPDLPAQILAYFRARRAGDIAVFAAPRWDLSTRTRAGHGGIRPSDMLVPMLLVGPNVPKGTIDAARTVDLLPTLMALLGRPVPAGLDGRSLVSPKAGN